MARRKKKYARRRNGSHRKPPKKHHAMFPRYSGRRIKRRRADKLVLKKRRAYRKYRRGALARGMVPMGSRGSNPSDVLVARWQTKGNDWIELWKLTEYSPRSGVGYDGVYHYKGKGMGGGIPNTVKTDTEAIAYMERPWGRGGAGPATVLKTDRPSLKRVRNPALRPFAGARGQIKMPYFDVLGRKFDDLDTAKAFADKKAEDGNQPVDVMSKPDAWTMAYEAYVAYPDSMTRAERKEHHEKRWRNPKRRKARNMYKFRFVSEHLTGELSQLWHTSKTYSHKRYERLQWTTKWFHKKHPEYSSTAIYKDLTGMVEGY